MSTKQTMWSIGAWFVGVDLLPYQFALGASLRWWAGAPAFRLYVGPLKLWGGRAERSGS